MVPAMMGIPRLAFFFFGFLLAQCGTVEGQPKPPLQFIELPGTFRRTRDGASRAF